MRCVVLSFLALAATASAGVVTRRGEYGYWDFSGSVSFPASGYTSYKVDATYHNDEITTPIEVTCSYLYNPQDKTETASCSDPSFTYDFGGVSMANTVATVSLRQTISVDGGSIMIDGAQELDFDFSQGSGRSGSASGVIHAETIAA